MKYLAILGRQSEISIAELEAQFPDIKFWTGPVLASSSTSAKASTGVPQARPPVYIEFSLESEILIDKYGGLQKVAVRLDDKPLDYLQKLPEGKLTIGVSDYSSKASKKTAQNEALKLKKILVRHGRSVRVVENKDAVLSTATTLHNGLSGKNERKIELIKVNEEWYRVVGVQDIDAYTMRDQKRPARDAKVGMLPPKLAQILINLCGPLPEGATVLDPFCGTGVVLQEAFLMGYKPYGTDISERMVEYSKKNLDWLMKSGEDSIRGIPEPGKARTSAGRPWQTAPWDADDPKGRWAGRTRPENGSFQISEGDATSFTWQQPIDAVACEGYLGKPMSEIPSDIKMKEQKQECGAIIKGFLKNLAGQIKKDTPVTIAAPAWLRSNDEYERLDIIDEIEDMGYNVNNKTREGLLYHRKDQIVARDIIILRKK